MSLAAPTFGAGGPVILGGDDLNDHGVRENNENLRGWLYIEKALGNLNSNVTRARPFTVDIAALDVEDDGSCPFGNPPAKCPGLVGFTNHGGAVLAAAADNAGLTVQFFPSAAGISDFFSSISATPAIRIDPSINLTPQTVIPDGDKNIRIDILLEGVEQQS